MATTSIVGRILLVTLTAEETELWKRGDTQEAAKYRLTIKRPARGECREAGLAKIVYATHDESFLEENETYVRACDSRTIRARCEVRGAWFPALPPSERRHSAETWRARVALLDSATDAADVYAWLLEAAIADAVTPGVDLDPSSDTGALVIDAANRRLLGRAMGRTLYEVFTREAGAPAMGR